MNRREQVAHEAAVAAGDSRILTRLHRDAEARGQGRQRQGESARASEILTVAPILERLLELHDEFVMVRDAAAVVEDRRSSLHQLTSETYVGFDALARNVRDHWQPVVLPAAERAAPFPTGKGRPDEEGPPR